MKHPETNSLPLVVVTKDLATGVIKGRKVIGHENKSPEYNSDIHRHGSDLGVFEDYGGEDSEYITEYGRTFPENR